MDTSGKKVNQVPDNLLSFLREELGNPKVDYEVPPSQLDRGNETSVFKFQLKNAHPSLSGPLVLRLFDKLNRSNHAIKERAAHNSLVDQGFPVPYVYYDCIDPKYFGYQFLIMDFLPGDILPSVFGQDTAVALGKAHAALHNADASQLNEVLIAGGFRNPHYSIDAEVNLSLVACGRSHCLREIVKWLIDNGPPGCEHPAICHGDFHPGNLLAKDGKVSAIFDWSCCQIGDPVMDVASTLVVFNAATKHLIPSIDSKIETRKYLEAYRSERDLNEQHLEYFQVLGCATALFAGINGILVWTLPPIQNELTRIIYDFSKIRLEIPG